MSGTLSKLSSSKKGYMISFLQHRTLQTTISSSSKARLRSSSSLAGLTSKLKKCWKRQRFKRSAMLIANRNGMAVESGNAEKEMYKEIF